MEENINKLKASRLKVTPQRLAIFELIKGDRTHPSAEKIYEKISKRYPRISFATVYNTLSKLVEIGEIQELDIDPDKKRFDPYTPAHCHFYCRVCGNIYDVECDASFKPDIKKVGGHWVESRQLNFKGVCEDCKGKNEERNHA
jgi:Fur family transcriptional regulator, peroxide stress response regulator